MKDQTNPADLAQMQAELDQAQKELEKARTYAKDLFFENQEMRKRLETLSVIENSAGWKVAKRMRGALRLLATEGPIQFTRRASSWLARNRGHYFDQPTKSTKPARFQPPQDWVVTRQYMPDEADFSGVSIVIPVFNALDYTKACIASIYQAQVKIPFEVLVVNNGSQPEVQAWLETESQQRERLYYLTLSHNLGFAKAVNIGLQKARGQYIVIHNSDTVATTGWLDYLVNAGEHDPELGIMSPMTNYVGEGLQMDEAARGITAAQAERYAAKIRDRTSLIPIPDRLVFFSVMMKRTVVEQVGGLNEGAGLGNFEDDDYCLRTRLAGFKLAIVQNAFVYHHGSKTFTANNINHTNWMDQNRHWYLDTMSKLSGVFPPHVPRSRPRDKAEVSVIVRTCNRPDTLRIALASLANQTFDPFEVVLVNDGGEDVSGIIGDFEPFLPIRYIQHPERKGAGAALNAGVQAAHGKWVSYLDDDDIIYPYHLEALWAALARTRGEYLFVYSDYNRALLEDRGNHSATIARVPMPTWEFNARDLYANNNIPLHTWMHARECLERVGGFDESLLFFEDWDFLIRTAARYKFLPLRRMTCEYRFYLDRSNATVRQRARQLEQMNIIFDRYPVKDPVLRIRRERMRKGVALQIAEIERLKELEKHEILSGAEIQQQVLSVIAGFQFDS